MKLIWLLRICGFVLLIILAFRPVIMRPDPGLPSTWAIVLDTSQSMRVKDSEMRFEVAKKTATQILDQYKRAKLFSSSTDVTELSNDALEKIKPDGVQSNLAKGVKEIFETQNYRGAVFITDGQQVGSGDPLNEAASVGRPLIFVGVGDKSQFRDIMVREVQSPPFAFKNIETSLTALLSIIGYKGNKITVKLREGNNILGVQTVEVNQDDAETAVSFNWRPTQLGTKILTVEASTYEGEITTKNNRKQITMDVGRDRFRVLYICGKPGPEYGFLRHQFKADPAVELVTFVILRNASNIVSVPDAELSLIPFPTQDVLMKQMETFDLVVFEEFSFREYGLLDGVMQAIKKKVENGGSFLLMGGEDAFGPRSHYTAQDIQEMIPVQFGNSQVKTGIGKFQFKPKSLGHPILRLDGNMEQNKKYWNKLPEVEEVTLLPGVKPGATIFGTVHSEGKEFPVLVGWPYKKGRVITLATRTTWRWSMLGEPLAYQQFWKNMVLWLTQSDQFRQVRMAMEPKSLKRGEKGTVRVWVFDEYFTPISDVKIRAQLTKPNGETESIQLLQETTGVFSAQIEGVQEGESQIKVWVLRNNTNLGSDQLKFQVQEGHLEDQDLRPNFTLLTEMAEASGGRFIPADQFTPDVLNEFDEDLAKSYGKKVLLWNSPWLFGVLILILFGEWILRRRQGLL